MAWPLNWITVLWRFQISVRPLFDDVCHLRAHRWGSSLWCILAWLESSLMCQVYKGGEGICKRKPKNMVLKKMTSIKFSLWLGFRGEKKGNEPTHIWFQLDCFHFNSPANAFLIKLSQTVCARNVNYIPSSRWCRQTHVWSLGIKSASKKLNLRGI